MRVGQVIGRLTFCVQEEAFKGLRWLVVSPVDTDEFNTCIEKAPRISKSPNLIVCDQLGAGQGDIIGFVEGAEATAPFKDPTPIDALCIAIFDTIQHVPSPL